MCAEIDERVNAFRDQPIEGEWPYLWLDATDVTVRQAGCIVSGAVKCSAWTSAARQRRRSGRLSCASWLVAGCAVSIPGSSPSR